ncbi:SirB2 family protein [Undibacterium sp. LX40W]|uniref:SirB2 family protein n=1 Tax=Undibacterium nitidum TaxID=2762298 RepID=A0A923KMZ4_9BURK|nr:SirB2 family protein [Undibacterium nitidum]MBC3883425.1 SirB2 family protein [Undibacterium nitidum]MBC3893707.1 SirB2 family protein [Undibacterium sp. LX40W]
MNYLALKHLHITCVILSFSFFLTRFYWRLNTPEKLQLKWVKITPHVVDTALLLSAFAMAWLAQLNPLQHAWLFGKIVVLINYIVCGSIALKYSPSRQGQILAFCGALFSFVVIVSLAINKHLVPI